MKDFNGIEFASEHNGTDVFRVIELAYEQGWKDGHSEQLGTNLASLGTDCISRQAAIETIDSFNVFESRGDQIKLEQMIGELPPAQPEIIRCKDCKHRWTHKCMDSMPIERCDLEQTFYDAEVDYCSLAERREVTT